MLLSLSALIKARELWIVFEGILFKKKKKKEDTPIKVCVLRASEEREKSYGTPVLPLLRRSQQDSTHDLQSRVTSKNAMKFEDGGGDKIKHKRKRSFGS